MRLAALWATMQAKAAAGELPAWRQLLEMGWLLLRHRMGPGYYLMARFWRRDLPFGDKCRHWNGDKYLRFVHKVNDPAYFKVSQNKLVEKSLLARLGLPTAPLVGLFHAHKGQSVEGHALTTLQELKAALEATRTRHFFCKPAEGDSGDGVFALDLDTHGWRDPSSGQPMVDDELRRRFASSVAGYVIEQRIEQHAELAALNPSSVNTLRIWVVDDRQGVRVVGAFLRIGRAGSVVDNTAAGGLACPVDVRTGVIQRALDLTSARNEHRTHPDTAEILPGRQLPHWPACVQVACTALRVLPGARFAGMDVAIGVEGPLVVEYNVEPNQRGAAHFDVPHASLFSGFQFD